MNKVHVSNNRYINFVKKKNTNDKSISISLQLYNWN